MTGEDDSAHVLGIFIFFCIHLTFDMSCRGLFSSRSPWRCNVFNREWKTEVPEGKQKWKVLFFQYPEKGNFDTKNCIVKREK